MSRCELASKPLIQCLKRNLYPNIAQQSLRFLSSSASCQNDVQIQKNPDSAATSSPRLEGELVKSGDPPTGSRRRRAALQQTTNIPFEQLPYQCFQEARKVLLADRDEKLKQIETERARIARLKAADLGNMTEQQRNNRLRSMEKHLEKLKIWADFNDPMVKKKFEDGMGMR
jgi:large subunit ribosomal protein L35